VVPAGRWVFIHQTHHEPRRYAEYAGTPGSKSLSGCSGKYDLKSMKHNRLLVALADGHRIWPRVFIWPASWTDRDGPLPPPPPPGPRSLSEFNWRKKGASMLEKKKPGAGKEKTIRIARAHWSPTSKKLRPSANRRRIAPGFDEIGAASIEAAFCPACSNPEQRHARSTMPSWRKKKNAVDDEVEGRRATRCVHSLLLPERRKEKSPKPPPASVRECLFGRFRYMKPPSRGDTRRAFKASTRSREARAAPAVDRTPGEKFSFFALVDSTRRPDVSKPHCASAAQGPTAWVDPAAAPALRRFTANSGQSSGRRRRGLTAAAAPPL